MAEHIAIEQGRPPWQPAEDAELVEVLHQYDMPLIGVIRHGTSLHLFRCIEGHTEPSQLWAYTPLSPEELDRLRADDGDLDALVDELSTRRPTVLALASEDRGVTLSALVADPSGYETPLHAARAALGEALDEVDAKLGRSVA
jgi:hypothetical protein